MTMLSESACIRNQDDRVTRAYSRRFHNIYLFITERCQLRCGHCYMGDRLDRGLMMKYEQASAILACCSRLGAEYLTFVGGEPTLHPDLLRLIDYAVEVGYRKVMVDTNGLSIAGLVSVAAEKLYYIRVSLDGASAATHEIVRGFGTFQRTLTGIRKLVAAGHRVRVTCTVLNFNRHELPAMLHLADDLGVDLVNFHSFSEEGYGCSNADWAITPEEWIEVCETIEALRPRFKVAVRYPPTWVRPEDVSGYAAKGYRGCLGCSLDRLSIFPDGRCYVCSMLFDTALNFGYITDQGFRLNKGLNEYSIFTAAALQAEKPALTGCPAEVFLNKQPGQAFVSVCRLWRTGS